jgi:hypothetical protein
MNMQRSILSASKVRTVSCLGFKDAWSCRLYRRGGVVLRERSPSTSSASLVCCVCRPALRAPAPVLGVARISAVCGKDSDVVWAGKLLTFVRGEAAPDAPGITFGESLSEARRLRAA